MGCVIVFLHALTLTLRCSVDYGLGEERQELIDGASLVEREARNVRSSAQDRTWRSWGCKDDRN